MKTKLGLALAVSVSLLTVRILAAQDLGPNIRKIKDGIYVYVGTNLNSNCGIVQIVKYLATSFPPGKPVN